MPRIANGKIVDDAPSENRERKSRVLTWDEFTKTPRPSSQNQHASSNREERDQSKKEDVKQLTVKAPATVTQYLARILHIEEYNLLIPRENPVIRINAVFLVFFALFTFLFGYKMAVYLKDSNSPVDRPNSCTLLARTQNRMNMRLGLLHKQYNSLFILNMSLFNWDDTHPLDTRQIKCNLAKSTRLCNE